MKIKNALSILVIFLLIFSCKKEVIQPDNLYKFKEYLSYTTAGVVSTTQNIEVNLAKEVDGWEANKDITSEIISVKPYCKRLRRFTSMNLGFY
jgi:hypothetical protein